MYYSYSACCMIVLAALYCLFYYACIAVLSVFQCMHYIFFITLFAIQCQHISHCSTCTFIIVQCICFISVIIGFDLFQCLLFYSACITMQYGSLQYLHITVYYRACFISVLAVLQCFHYNANISHYSACTCIPVLAVLQC